MTAPAGTTLSGRPAAALTFAVNYALAPVESRDAFQLPSSASAVQVETCSEGGQDVGYIANGDWLQFNNVNFGTGGVKDFLARVASGAGSGVSGLVEVRLDSRSNAPIGSFALANTGGWQTWTSIPGNVSSVTGTHTVYLTFTSGQSADFVNVNWFQFRK